MLVISHSILEQDELAHQRSQCWYHRAPIIPYHFCTLDNAIWNMMGILSMCLRVSSLRLNKHPCICVANEILSPLHQIKGCDISGDGPLSEPMLTGHGARLMPYPMSTFNNAGCKMLATLSCIWDAYVIWSPLHQIMGCDISGDGPLSEPMLTGYRARLMPYPVCTFNNAGC